MGLRSWFLEVREKVLRFRHEMVKVESGEIAAISELTGVHLDTRIRRSCPLPDQLAGRARAMLAAAPASASR